MDIYVGKNKTLHAAQIDPPYNFHTFDRWENLPFEKDVGAKITTEGQLYLKS
jgi:hypothetical protein